MSILFGRRYGLFWIRPRTKITRREAGYLKDRIRHRLKTEIYKCKLPDRNKPRVRYKLTTWGYVSVYDGSFTKVWL